MRMRTEPDTRHYRQHARASNTTHSGRQEASRATVIPLWAVHKASRLHARLAGLGRCSNSSRKNLNRGGRGQALGLRCLDACSRQDARLGSQNQSNSEDSHLYISENCCASAHQDPSKKQQWYVVENYWWKYQRINEYDIIKASSKAERWKQLRAWANSHFWFEISISWYSTLEYCNDQTIPTMYCIVETAHCTRHHTPQLLSCQRTCIL